MRMSAPRPPRDLRAYARSTTGRLIVGALVLLFLVGDGLIWAIYGKGPAVAALLCTALGLGPVLLVAGLLWLLDVLARLADRD